MQKQLKLYGSEESDNNDSKPTTRRLKVYYGSSYHDGNYSRHPVIRIGGNYLREFGFKIGDTVEVKLSNGRIEIARLDKE